MRKVDLTSYHERRLNDDDLWKVKLTYIAGFFLMPFAWLIIYFTYRDLNRNNKSDRMVDFQHGAEHTRVKAQIQKCTYPVCLTCLYHHSYHEGISVAPIYHFL